MCEAEGGVGATPTLLGTETGPAVAGADDRAGGGQCAWPMDENGSAVVAGLEK